MHRTPPFLRASVVVTAGLLAAACGSSASSGPAVAVAPAAVAPSYAPWPGAQHDATHSSEAAVAGPRSGHLRWKARIGPTTEGPSIGADGTIYEANDAGVLHAIDPRDGHDLWTFDGGGGIGGDLSTTAAVLPDGTVVWPGPRGTVVGLSPAGKRLWSVDVGSTPLSPAVVSSSDFYVTTRSGDLDAVRVTAGTAAIRWTLHLGSTSLGSPVVRRDGVVEATVDSSLVAVEDGGRGGRELWRFTVGKQVEVSPAVAADGTAVLGTNDGFEYGVSPAGRQVWKHSIDKIFSYSSPAVAKDGTAYFGDNNGFLTIVRVGTGEVIRTLKGDPGSSRPGNIWTSPAVGADGSVYYGTNDGHIYGWSGSGARLFDVTTGATVSSYPALAANGDLLIGSEDGYLYAIGG